MSGHTQHVFPINLSTRSVECINISPLVIQVKHFHINRVQKFISFDTFQLLPDIEGFPNTHVGTDDT